MARDYSKQLSPGAHRRPPARPLSPSEMAGQPKYKIGWRGRPFYLNTSDEWVLSNRPIAEVQNIIDFQSNPRREINVFAKDKLKDNDE